MAVVCAADVFAAVLAVPVDDVVEFDAVCPFIAVSSLVWAADAEIQLSRTERLVRAAMPAIATKLAT